MSERLLEVNKLTMRFGGVTAVSEVDLAVETGQIFAVIGPNGAGKTTVFNAVSGVYEPTAGEIKFEGRDLRRTLTRAHKIRFALVGLFTGLVLMFFMAGHPDRLQAWLQKAEAILPVKAASAIARWIWR